MADCSPQLQWLIQRKTSSFVLRKRNVKQPFSTVNKSQPKPPLTAQYS